MKTVIEMAREAGMAMGFTQGIAVMNHENLERFAVLVREEEREACAKVCDEIEAKSANKEDCGWAWECAAAIRARGDK